MNSEYQALLAKVAGFTEPVRARREHEMACRAGCDGCCHVWLAPCEVEADAIRSALSRLQAATRAQIAARGQRELAREQHGETPPRCAMLDEDGRCAVYDARPLVCRTQGHALRYPAGVIPASAIRKRIAGGEVSACVLNFTAEMPSAADTLDAERIDQLLALVNARHCAAHGLDPLARHRLSAIAVETDVLACHETPP